MSYHWMVPSPVPCQVAGSLTDKFFKHLQETTYAHVHTHTFMFECDSLIGK